MLLSDLSQEILIKIAHFLCLEDKASCSLVSKSWTRVFQDSMHSDLLFTSKDDLYDLVCPSQDYQINYRETGHLVRYLEVYRYLRTTEKQLYALQNTFQNIKYLCFKQEALASSSLAITANWHLWGSLREFSISLEDSIIRDAENTFLSIIMHLPLLRRLEIICEHFNENMISFSLSNFETIHSCLIHLAHLKLSSNLLTISDADLKCIAKIPPVTKMESFSIQSKKTDHRWLCYFAQKYPNLRTLELISLDPKQRECDTDTIYLLQAVCVPFQRLTKLNLNTYPSPKHLAEICLKKAKTIESFSLEAQIKYGIPLDLVGVKHSLYNLVKLVLKDSTLPIELDILLKVAPRLKELLLQRTNVRVKGEIYNSKRFGLQLFSITESTITSDVLRFLSFHCRNLNSLRLIETVVSGPFSVPGCQFIDMTYTRLESFFTRYTRFVISDSREFPENLNIALITRPVEDIPPKQEYDPNVLPIIIGGVPTKAHYQWFYTRKFDFIRTLSRTQGSRMGRFFANYEENKRNTIKRAAFSNKGNQHARWRTNCIFGYTKIKLGYVASFNI